MFYAFRGPTIKGIVLPATKAILAQDRAWRGFRVSVAIWDQELVPSVFPKQIKVGKSTQRWLTRR